MKRVLLSLSVIMSAITFAQTDINDARSNFAVGQTVTIKGVAQNGGELGIIRYIQDGTGGLPAYGNILNSVSRGDSITVTGVLFDYNGLLEISPANSFSPLGTGTEIPASNITIPDMGEPFEGELIRISNVTFTASGNFAANTNYDFTDGSNTGQLRVDVASNLVGQAIPSGAVEITGLQGEFSGVYQILPRDQADIITYVAPAQEINITIGGNTILNGGSYTVGTVTNTSVTIENLGISNNLTINSINFTGVDAADYAPSSVPTTVVPGGTQIFDIVFTPSTGGSKIASLEISSNDVDEDPYIIDLYGVGVNGLANEPTSNPSSLTFPVVTSYSLTGSYTTVADAESYLVLWKKGSAVTGVPSDASTYLRGDILGDATVAYVGPATAFTPRHIIANQDMYFSVYAYNGPSGFENYKTTAPTSANTTSLDNMMGSYYTGMDAGLTSFVSDLSSLINPHTVVSYGNYKSSMINQFELRDTVGNETVITCAYSGENKVFSGAFDWTATGYSREHTFAHSWMSTFPADSPFPGLPEYSDQHNLYPTNQTQANSVRSNLPLGVVVSPVFTYLDGKAGNDANGTLVYEPRDEQKGNAARAMFYMCTSYNGISGNSWVLPSNQDQDVLKQWHFNDLPDNYEIARNDFIYSVQSNRNPFIDSTDWVCFIDFYTMNYVSVGCNLSLNENKLNQDFKLYPVPAKNVLNVATKGMDELYTIKVVDASGRVVFNRSKISLSSVYSLNIESLKQGFYIMNISNKDTNLNKSFIVK